MPQNIKNILDLSQMQMKTWTQTLKVKHQNHRTEKHGETRAAA